MKSVKINEEKIKKIVKIIYIKEILGKALYERLDDYPIINNKSNELIEIAVPFEIQVLKKEGDYFSTKSVIKDKILELHKLCLGNELYRKSLIYFDENNLIIF